MLGCSLSVMAAGPCRAQSAPILPSGEHVSAGSVSVVRDGAGTMTLSQTSPTAIIGWNDFSIGAGGTVRFENGNGATLNRVEGSAISRLDGSLTATGSVYLINPHGIIIGKNGVVDVGGSFIASTLDIDDAAFLAGGDRTFAGPSRAAVVNLGRIGALGGDVALMATEVRNEGSINAPYGSGALVAGSSVLIRDVELDQGRFAVLLGSSQDSATNTGGIAAVTAELRAAGGSVYALAGNITGIGHADQFSVVGGHIILSAGDSGTVSIGKTRISALADQATGSIDVTGSTIDVAPGATLDVSGNSVAGQIFLTATNRVRFAGTALARATDQGGDVILTAPSNDLTGGVADTRGATAGTLYLFQPSFTVDSGLANAITRNLRTSNVAFITLPEYFGGVAEDGDITVTAPLNLPTSNTLSLLATDTVHFDQNVTAAGATKIALQAAGGDGGANISFAPNRSLTFTGPAGGGQGLNINGQDYTLIYNLADLRAIGNDPAAFYALARSISASSTVLTGPVAGGLNEDAFSGQFDGLGHSINGLRIDAPGQYLVGLFGSVSGGIRNVDLVGGSVVGGSEVGALAAALGDGSVARVNSSVSVTASGRTQAGGFGGLLGSAGFATVADSSSTGNVYAPGASGVGGLVGSMYGASITGSFATGNVTGGEETGGLSGGISRASVENSYATGSVTGTTDVGGLVGVTSFGGGVAGSRASGRVNGLENVGGLVGRQLSATVYDSSASGAVSASGSNGGGLVGFSDDGGVVDSSATGRVTGAGSLGGLVGSMNVTLVSDVTASGNVTASGSGAGGLVGRATSSTIDHAIASGAVQGVDAVGGLVGSAPGLTVDASSASGAVRGTTAVGGLIGAAGSTYGSTTNSFATGAVSGETNIGGLIGSADNVAIATSYATGPVTGNARSSGVGGLVGSLNASSLSDSHADGRVAGASNVGGLIGTSFSTTLRDVVASGTVNGTLGAGENIGGLIGRSEIDDIAGARAQNNVRGRVNVGGLIGRRTGGTLSDVSATGPVSGAQNVGALIGRDDPTP